MGKRQTFAPTLRSWLVAGTVGTSLALLFDGETGTRRRARLKERGQALFQLASRQMDTQNRKMGDRVFRGATERIQSYEPDNSNPDDNTLRDRIESQAFGHNTAPRGEYNLNVEDGIAVLRGQLNSQEDIQRLITLVADVPDVRGVESFLHTPGTAAPNKESALEASNESTDPT